MFPASLLSSSLLSSVVSLLPPFSLALLLVGLTLACGSGSAQDASVPPAPYDAAPPRPSLQAPSPQAPNRQAQAVQAQAVQAQAHSGQAHSGQAGFVGAAGSSRRSGPPEYVRYTAPEQAFTAEVPASWQVQTYIDRSHPNGTIPWTGMASPDGQIVIRSPDTPGALFMMPNPYVGRHAGQRAGLFPVRRVASAPQYAAEHAQRVAQELGCESARLVERTARPDIAQKAQGSMPAGAQQSVTDVQAGIARLDCRWQGTALTIRAGATLFVMQGVEGWMATTSSLITPTARVVEATRVTEHISRTTELNRAWMEREYREGQRRAAEASRAVWAQTSRERAAAAQRGTTIGAGSTGSDDDAGHRAFIHSIHGTQDLTDRHGDTVYGVNSSASYHWQDIHGTIVGTDIDSNPNPLEYERMAPAQR